MARREPLPWLKPAVLVGGLVPVATILLRGVRGELGADPIAQALNQLGLMALVFLIATLACTPLKTLTGVTWPLRIRRMLGLFAFFYASLHVTTYAAVDQRFDWQSINVRSAQPDRSQHAVSGALALVWDFTPGYAIGLSVSRSQRMPTAEELYANGPHVATGQFQIGDPNLGVETSRNIELTLRKKVGEFRFEASLYRNAISNFIFLESTGAMIDGLDVANFVAQDAIFYGAEAELRYAVTSWLDAAVFGDYVRARLKNDENLPRIPPGRLGGTLDARWDSWQAFVQFYHVFAQDKVAPFETRTGGYNMLNAGIAYGGAAGPLNSYQIYLRANNLLNEKAIVHTSFIKESAPLPGLNVTLGARITF